MADGTTGAAARKLSDAQVPVVLGMAVAAHDRYVVLTASEAEALSQEVIDLRTAVGLLNASLDSKDEELKEARAALRRAHDNFDDQSEVVEQLRAELGRCS